MLLGPARRGAHHLLPRVLTSQTHPHPGARGTSASSPLHPHSLLVPAPQPLTSRRGPAGAASLWSTRSWSRLQGSPFYDRLPPSGTPGLRTYGGHSLFPFGGGRSTLWFSLASPPPPPVRKPEAPSRAVEQSGRAFPVGVAGSRWKARGWGRAALPSNPKG